MILDVDPKLDVVFKHLFGNQANSALLIDLLHAVVQPQRPITALDFILAQSERTHPEDKETFGDIKVRDQGGRQFQVEMQWTARWFLPKRLLFYWGQYHPQQLRQGEHYMTLRPTFTICFLNATLFDTVPDHHQVFQLRERKSGVGLSDDLEMHLIELPKFTKTVEALTSPLDRWCYFLRHGKGLDLAALPPSLDVPMIRRAMEVLTVWTQEEREREIVAQRIKAKLDHDSLMADLRDEADRKGRESHKEGHKEGKEQGKWLGQIALYHELLKQPMPSETELSALSIQELADLANKLRGQFLANGH